MHADFIKNWRSIAGIINHPTLYLDESAVAANRTLYEKEVEYWDESFDHFLNQLDEMGISDDTLIFVTSDHGEEFLEHDFTGHGQSLFEEQIHIPLVVLNYEHANVKEVSAITQNLDIVPTITEILGLPMMPSAQGESLTDIMRDEDYEHGAMTAFSELPATDVPVGELPYTHYKYQRACYHEKLKDN